MGDLINDLLAKMRNKLMFKFVNCFINDSFLQLKNNLFSLFIRNCKHDYHCILKLGFFNFCEEFLGEMIRKLRNELNDSQ